MKLGLVTYMWGAKWDLPTLIKNCELTGFESVELRSTHLHGVEPSASPEARKEIRQRFQDSKVVCIGLGSACEYHNTDHGIVRQNIDQTKTFVKLSHDIGATGVKVRPNGLVKGEERRVTIERIGAALAECGAFAAEFGQEIRVEVHGGGTSQPAVMKEIIDSANHPAVKVCWNSNPGETVGGSLQQSFDLLKQHLGQTVHLHDLFDDYPYRELFCLLVRLGYRGYCLAECPETADPIRVMKYYRELWLEFVRNAGRNEGANESEKCLSRMDSTR